MVTHNSSHTRWCTCGWGLRSRTAAACRMTDASAEKQAVVVVFRPTQQRTAQALRVAYRWLQVEHVEHRRYRLWQQRAAEGRK